MSTAENSLLLSGDGDGSTSYGTGSPKSERREPSEGQWSSSFGSPQMGGGFGEGLKRRFVSLTGKI